MSLSALTLKVYITKCLQIPIVVSHVNSRLYNVPTMSPCIMFSFLFRNCLNTDSSFILFERALLFNVNKIMYNYYNPTVKSLGVWLYWGKISIYLFTLQWVNDLSPICCKWGKSGLVLSCLASVVWSGDHITSFTVLLFLISMDGLTV